MNECLPSSMSVHHMHAVFAEPRRERQIPAPRVLSAM